MTFKKMATKPNIYKRLTVQNLASNFREAVSIETSEICHPKKREVCVKNKYVGINATDVYMTDPKYNAISKPPFGLGMEAVGEIVEVGEGMENLKVGQSIAYLDSRRNAYSEYTCVATEDIFVIPEVTPSYLGIIVSGLTATIALDKAARIMAGEIVLITAAAGGAGHIAVQWAKAAGCHVIGTCSTEEKANLLKDLGCDRVINYKMENIADILAKEYPKGVNVVWETIGGQMFEDCFKNLSVRGRLIVGGIFGLRTETKEVLSKRDLSTLPEQLMFKSASVIGFFALTYIECFPSYFKVMTESIESGKLKIVADDGKKSTGQEFFGIEGIIKAVEHLDSGKSSGKVIARLY